VKYLFSVIIIFVFVGSCSYNTDISIFPIERRVVEPLGEIPLDDSLGVKILNILYDDYFRKTADTMTGWYKSSELWKFCYKLFKAYHDGGINIQKKDNKIIYVASNINGYEIYSLELPALQINMSIAIDSMDNLVTLSDPYGKRKYHNYRILIGDDVSNYLATIKTMLYLIYGEGLIIQNKKEPFTYWDSLNPKPDTRYLIGEWRLPLIIDGVVQRLSVMSIFGGISFTASYCFGHLKKVDVIECSLTKSDGLNILKKIEIGYPDQTHY
jgi:hypothetical protein